MTRIMLWFCHAAKGGVIGFVLAGYIIVSADVAHLSVLIHKAVVLLFAILSSTTFMDSNPHKCREESSVIKKVENMEVLLEEE